MGVSYLTEQIYNPIEIGNRLVLARKNSGLTQEEVAYRLSISRDAVSKYENGINKIPAEILVKFGWAYNVSIDYLVTGKENETAIKLDEEIIYMIEKYTPKQRMALMNILKGIQDICQVSA